MSLFNFLKDLVSPPPAVWVGGAVLVPVVDVERIYVEEDIKIQQVLISEWQETKNNLTDRVNDYGKALDSALQEELAEYKKLENELAIKAGKDVPFEEPLSKEEQAEAARQAAERREEQQVYKMDLSPDADPRVHKLYKKYAKIFHPDLADNEEDRVYFHEVFQMLNHYKMMNDYQGLKSFCKQLRKGTKDQVMNTIEALKAFLQELQEEVSVLKSKCHQLENDPVQERADAYYAHPETHIEEVRATLNNRIAGLRQQLNPERPASYGGGLWG